ncbi:UPF0759 protein YunF [Lysinibacillus sp. PLM2]|nr:UPF0759 protein YunF [Lysinibacillus sp. PLM2]
MIYIGLTGWGDHPNLYSELSTSRDKLFDYSGHFPVVEVDTSFYGIPSLKSVEKWCNDTPSNFKFVLKAYQGITGHLRDELPFESRNDMFNAFKECAKGFQSQGKLAMILVQFPPWFDCQNKNVQYIRYVKQQLADFPIAIEFRNQSWYSENNRDEMLKFLQENELIHTVCDEPQAGSGSIPLLGKATSKEKALFRIHGRNIHGWRNAGNNQNWREVRFLYDYNEEELEEIVTVTLDLQKQSRDVFVLFNNNSGHHAAKNAKRIMEMLNIEYSNLSPKQLNMFEGDF